MYCAVYTQNRGRAEKSRSRSVVSSTDGKDKTVKRVARHRQNEKPALVVLGFLPFRDEIDRELHANGYALARVKAIADAAEQPHVNECEAMEKYAYLLRHGPMSLRDYWDAFAQYLRSPSLAERFEPVTPGVYRELLERRQKIRDTRLQCLKPYTGLQRVRADDGDVVAGCQPIFLRFAEAMLCEAGQGVASLVTSPEFLDNSDMAGMRKHLVDTYSRITIDHVVENSRAGAPLRHEHDEAVAMEPPQSEIALCHMLKTSGNDNCDCEVLYSAYSYAEAMQLPPESHTGTTNTRHYQTLTANSVNKYVFLPAKVSRKYLSWPSLADIAAMPPIGGMMEKRVGALIDIDRERLKRRLKDYFDKNISWEILKATGTGLTEAQNRFDPQATREVALAASEFRPNNIRPYTAKPFDNRWCYHSRVKSLWSDPKPQLADLQKIGNRFVLSRARKAIADEGIPFFFTPMIGDGDVLRGHTFYFPMRLRGDDGAQGANLSAPILEYLGKLGIIPDITPVEAGRLVWNHVLGMGFSSAYLNENAEGIDQGWPHIPFPAVRDGNSEMNVKARELFMESSRLGEIIANLLNLTVDVAGVTQGDLRPDFASMAIPWDTVNDTPVPLGALDMVPVTMEWGKLSKEKAVLPSYGGMISRKFSPEERLCLEEGALIGGVRAGAAYACLGDETWEIRLSDTVGIWNIPTRVWNFTIGGYRVLQKWLSYRVDTIIGRPLTFDEVESFCQIVRRIAALLMMGPKLNQTYAKIRDICDTFDD